MGATSHCIAASKYDAFKSSKVIGSVKALLDDGHSQYVKENRDYLKAVLDVVFVCARQGIASRHREGEESQNRGNFLVLLELVAKHDKQIADRLAEGSKNAKCTHHSIQDDFIHSIAQLIRQDITSDMSDAVFYCIICDEAKDASKEEQISICLRYYDESAGHIKEAFWGFTPAKDGQDAASLKSKILASLTENKVDLGSSVAQCYDGASVMSGRLHGLQVLMRKDMPNAIYIHSYSHRLNLVVVDVVNGSARLADLLDTFQQLHNFMIISTVHTIFMTKQKQLYSKHQTRELPSVSETRWVCQHKICFAVLETLKAVVETIDEVAEMDVGKRAVTARNLQMRIHSSFVGHLVTMEWILKICGDATEALQPGTDTLQTALDLISDMETLLTRTALLTRSRVQRAKGPV